MLKLFKELAIVFVKVVGCFVLVSSAVFFPWNVDPAADESKAAAPMYQKYYAAGTASKGIAIPASFAPLSESEQFYTNFAREMASRFKVTDLIADFVRQRDLADKHVLEVGAGSGLLQDAVADYTGLDISPSAARFFHKPFVAASATDMPFPSNSFDGLWSVWVLEHIPNPEKALLEMRRVVKPGGYMFLMPAFRASRYLAGGYRVRPFSDLDWEGKAMKLSSYVTEMPAFELFYSPATKALRSIGTRLLPGPSRLHFTRLSPNYDQYWEPDSDATTSLSEHELYLWFKTRGDQCLNCDSEWDQLGAEYSKLFLVIRVNKPADATNTASAGRPR